SRTVNLFYQQGNRYNINTSSFLTRNYGAKVVYGFPLSEVNRYSLGLGYRHGMMAPYCSSPIEFKNFVGNPANGRVEINPSFCPGLDPTVPVNVPLPTLTYDNIMGMIGFAHDTRNRTVLPTRGTLQQLQLRVALPIGSETYYKATWSQFTFVPLGAGFVYGVNSLVGIGGAYGDTSSLPPYEHFFAGGPSSVAGYQSGTLTPLDSNGLSYGGEFATWVRNELIIPNFLGGPSAQHSYRVAFFLDAGNVFATPGDFSWDGIRGSYGIALTWLTPLGAMRFSYAIPFHYQPGDRLERFQFSLGAYF
ncbi:MAG: BamA/TamA family outer membrane protein, partial [Gammaproteobacteria bacterium]|nr:BamA/TamA family outer membrane protein [Gammaproteobacteria bacterium]